MSKWWEDWKFQLILNEYFPRRTWLVAEASRKFVDEKRQEAGLV